MELEAEGLLLRGWRPGDEPALVRHADNPRIWRWLRDAFPHPYTAADAADWIRRTRALGEPPLSFAIVEGGEPIGAVGLALKDDVHRHTAEIGYWVAEPLWGRGIATRAIRAATRYGFETFDLARIEACVFEGNAASARALEKAGYRLEAQLAQSVTKEGRLLDSFLYARLRSTAGPVSSSRTRSA